MLALTASFTAFAQRIQKPEIPGNFRNQAAADTTNIADIKWKNFFEEGDLTKLIDVALAKNSDLQIAEKNIAIAKLQFGQAKWNNVPQLNASVSATTTRLSENSLNGISVNQVSGKNHVEDYSAGLNLSWEADIWGKIRNRKKAAQAAYMQTSEAKKALQTTIVAMFSKGFYDLLMLDAQLAIAKKTLELNDKTLFAVSLQYDAGRVTLLAKQQTEGQRLLTAQLIPELEQNIELQENALSVLSGEFPAAKERTSLLENFVVNENLSAGIPSQLLSKRPDVKSAELALKEANAKVGITKAQLYPSLTITAAAGVNSFESINWFTIPASLFGSVAGGLTAPLLNGKRLRTEYEIAKLERDQAAINFKQTVLVAVGEVSNALVEIEKQKQQFNLSGQRVETLKQSVKNAALLFESNLATYFEVNNAQSDLLQAELELAEIKKERLSSNVELYRALGGGWE